MTALLEVAGLEAGYGKTLVTVGTSFWRTLLIRKCTWTA